MAVKIAGVLRGQSPKEQFKLERKRFKARQVRAEIQKEVKREKLLEADDGKNQKLS